MKEKIAVIGLGRVGLPLALVLADSGLDVIGIDKDKGKISMIKSKNMPFLESGTAELLKRTLDSTFTIGNLDRIRDVNAIIITVGTLLSDDLSPDSSDVFSVLRSLKPFLRNGQLIILRSTVEPRGTERVSNYLAKNIRKKIFLAYAPERLAEGFAVKELYNLPQIIGSLDKKSAKLAEDIFIKFAPEVIHTDPLTAELAKLSLNTYRYSTFAVANELMMIADYYDKDIFDILRIANQNYPRGGIPSPGFAAGPCLVKDSFFIRHATPFNSMITGSFMINDSLPDHFVRLIKKKTKIKGKKIAFLGLTFKRNVDDIRSSLPLKMSSLLEKEGAVVYTHDPYVKNSNLEETIKNADVLVVAINHDQYKELSLKRIGVLAEKECLVCDIWNIFGKDKIFFYLHNSAN